jgi:hypothetical protein
MAYQSYAERETENQKIRAKLQDALQPFNHPEPAPFVEEMTDQYRKRALPHVQQHAPNFQNVKIEDARGTAFDLLEKQIYDDAAREARNPTQIPEGELREIKRIDQAGRVSYEFFGKPSVWLDQFSPGRKRLAGIRTETERGYRPSNVSENLFGTRY